MSILTLDEAKKLIANSSIPTSRYDDDEIQSDIDAAEDLIAAEVGALTLAPVTVTAESRNGIMLLPTGPYVGPVTELTLNGVEASWESVQIDSYGIARGLADGLYTVTYTAGWVTVPPRIRKAIEEQFKHLWSFRRGNTQQRETTPGAAHAVPYRVAELVAGYRWDGPLT